MSTDKTPTKKNTEGRRPQDPWKWLPCQETETHEKQPYFLLFAWGTVCMRSLEMGSHCETARWRINREQSQGKVTRARDG